MGRVASRVVARLAGAAAASGLALAGLVVAAVPASAAACSGSSGVTVVVDRGGSISTRCASGDPSSALSALKSAGFTVDYPRQFLGSVVCRINGYPTPTDDPCVRMPPASAYWAFFHAKRGGSWVYSSSGAASYNPAPGSVVGFRFGSGQQPGIAPPAPPKTSAPAPTKTTPKPAPKPPTTKPKPQAEAEARALGTEGHLGLELVGPGRQGRAHVHRQGQGAGLSGCTVRHTLGEPHGIRQCGGRRNRHPHGKPERDGIRHRSGSDVRRRERRRRRPGHPARRGCPGGAGRRWGRLRRVEAAVLTR